MQGAFQCKVLSSNTPERFIAKNDQVTYLDKIVIRVSTKSGLVQCFGRKDLFCFCEKKNIM